MVYIFLGFKGTSLPIFAGGTQAEDVVTRTEDACPSHCHVAIATVAGKFPTRGVLVIDQLHRELGLTMYRRYL